MSGSPVFSRTIDGKWILIGVNCGHMYVGGSAAGVLTRFVRSSALIDLLEAVGAVTEGPSTTSVDSE